jgi:hypothetical protein
MLKNRKNAYGRASCEYQMRKGERAKKVYLKKA